MKTVISVHPGTDHTLTLEFSDKKTGVFDMKPYLDIGIFQEFRMSHSFRPLWGILVLSNGRMVQTSILSHSMRKVWQSYSFEKVEYLELGEGE